MNESVKIRNENTEMDNKEVKKLAQNNWNHLSSQQRKGIIEELSIEKKLRKVYSTTGTGYIVQRRWLPSFGI